MSLWFGVLPGSAGIVGVIDDWQEKVCIGSWCSAGWERIDCEAVLKGLILWNYEEPSLWWTSEVCVYFGSGVLCWGTIGKIAKGYEYMKGM